MFERAVSRPSRITADNAYGVDLYAARRTNSTLEYLPQVESASESGEAVTLDEAIRGYAHRIIEANPVTPLSLERIFVADASHFSQSQVDYFKAYMAIAVPELVRGSVERLKKFYDEETIIQFLKNDEYLGYIFRSELIFHDVMHTVLQIGMSGTTNLQDIRPLFQRQPLDQLNPTDDNYTKHRRAIERDEIGALLWYRVTSGISNQHNETLDLIKSSSNEKEFITKYFGSFDFIWATAHDPEHLEEIDPYFRSVLGRVYREYASNPMVLYAIFEETTRRFMQVNDPARVSNVKR